MISKRVYIKTNTKFDYKSKQLSKTNNNTNNQKQTLKQPVKFLYCECDESCYPIVYDQ